MTLAITGAFCFGSVVGWMTHFTLQRATRVDTRWLGSIVAIIGGGALTKMYDPTSGLFGAYAIGLAGSFFFRNFIAVPFGDVFFGELKNWQVIDSKDAVRFEGSKPACKNWATAHFAPGEYSIRNSRG